MNPLKKLYRGLARGSALIVVALALTTVGASLFHSENLPTSIFRETGREVFAFLCLTLCGAAVWLWTEKPLRRRARLAARIFGAVACALGFIALLKGFPGGGPSSLIPASMTPLAAASIVLLGGALSILDWSVRGKVRPAEYGVLLAACLGISTLFGYICNITLFPGLEDYTYMTLPHALEVLILAFGILCARPVGGLMLVLFSATEAGYILRRLLLLVVVSFPLLNWIRLIGEWNHWYRRDFGVILLIVTCLALFALAMLILGAGLVRSEMSRRKAEHHQRLREADFRATFDQAAVGLAHVSPSGRFLRANDKLCALLGYSREELVHLTFQEITHPDDLKPDLELFERVVAGEIERYTTEKRYLRRDGSIFWANLTVAILRSPSGALKYFISVIEDISAWKQAQEELEAANKAKNRFISIISHELRTPLTPVLAALSTGAAEAGSLSEPETLEMMRRNIEHEASIIDDLLDLTRISSSGKLKLELKPIDLHALIKEVFQSIERPLQTHGISGRLTLAATECIVEGDPTRLRQVLLNLLDNAIKFTPNGGLISVETATRENKRIEVRVSDSGAGIDPAHIDRIFDAFEQGEQSIQRRHGGLGLGLAIAKGLVEAHGGKIRAENTAHGTVFTFDLCLTGKPVPTGVRHRTTDVRRVQLLLVEDHEDTRRTLQRLLQRRGHTVATATGVAEATAASRHHAFDLVISDIGLPDGSGLDIPRALRSGGRLTPCIALSGFGTEEDIQKSAAAGFSRHITKPVDMSALDAAIAEIMLQEAPAQEPV